MTICNFSCGFYRKRINISVTLVSESYVILYCEKKCNSSINICLNQGRYTEIQLSPEHSQKLESFTGRHHQQDSICGGTS
jgi:hypothetical protein